MKTFVCMKKTIICLSAPADTGKTTTIWKLFEQLGGKNREYYPEVEDSINYRGHKIGCMSTGDPGSSQKESLEKLLKEDCDIVVAASRSYGKTVEDADELAKQYGYDFIRISLLFMYTEVGKNLFNLSIEANVRFILNIIDKLIAGEPL